MTVRSEGDQNRPHNGHEAETIVARLRNGRRPLVTTWPGDPEVAIEIHLQPRHARQLALADAHARFKELGLEVNLMTAEELEAEVAVQLLFRAIKVPGQTGTLFRDVDQFRTEVSDDEMVHLWRDYQALERDSAPSLVELDGETFDAIRDAIKKKDPTLLSSFGHRALSSWLLIGASQLPSLTTIEFSSGRVSPASSGPAQDSPAPIDPVNPEAKP